MNNEEWIEFLRKQKEASVPRPAPINENISKIQTILKHVAATQERTKKLLATFRPEGE